MRPEYEEEKCKTKIELEEMTDGTWQVREIRIFTYENPLEARNKIETYMYKKIGNGEKEKIDGDEWLNVNIKEKE